MSLLSHPARAQVEYDPPKPRMSFDRVFQIPNMFRPAFPSFFGNTIGRVNLERPAYGLTAFASWLRFARWRRMHPVARPADRKRWHDRTWLYQSVIEKEGLDRTPIDFWEFGVFRGDSLFWWLKNISNAESRFLGFDTFTGLPERWRATKAEGAYNVYGRFLRPRTRVALSSLASFKKRSCFLSGATISLDDW
jgi:hypothetical protein